MAPDQEMIDNMLASPLFTFVLIGVGLLVISFLIGRQRLEDELPSRFESIIRWVGIILVVGAASWALAFGIPRKAPRAVRELHPRQSKKKSSARRKNMTPLRH